MNPRPEPQVHPLEAMDGMQRRRFLSLAAFASAAVVGVGVAGPVTSAAAADTDAAVLGYDPESGWPIFAGTRPPAGYVRQRPPCGHLDYVDIPRQALRQNSRPVAVLRPPYGTGRGGK